jgi:hypothetical protein
VCLCGQCGGAMRGLGMVFSHVFFSGCPEYGAGMQPASDEEAGTSQRPWDGRGRARDLERRLAVIFLAVTYLPKSARGE